MWFYYEKEPWNCLFFKFFLLVYDYLKVDYKKKIKSMVAESISDIEFNKPSDRRKPMQIFSSKTRENILSYVTEFSNEEQNLKVTTLLKAAKIIRNYIIENSKLRFTGTFDDYTPPPLTLFFSKYIIQGTRSVHIDQKAHNINKNPSLLAHTIVQSINTNRQVSFFRKINFSLSFHLFYRQ